MSADTILLLLIVVCGVVLAISVAIRSRRLAEQKQEIQQKDETIRKQNEVVNTFNETSESVAQIHQKAEAETQDLLTAVKEAQTSEEPIKKSISLGNDIVDGFNNK